MSNMLEIPGEFQYEIEPRDFDDISLTFVRAAKPVKLLSLLKYKRIVVKHTKGVYNIKVTKKMDVKKARELVRLEKKAYTKWE